MDTKAIQSSTKFLKEEKGTFQGGYRGIPIFAGENLHEVCFETIMSLDLRKDIEILVLGAGAGAFDQRLIDHGYHNITAVEFVKENYQAENTRVFDYDLNEEFQNKFEGKKFDLVIAIEIIEHLYSPYDFFKENKSTAYFWRASASKYSKSREWNIKN
jgi:2-polyprenyl-3-methyl-5-hydroxy-6-metoxy-1,4-benzoquinol methylase